jgi:hypothetical protein
MKKLFLLKIIMIFLFVDSNCQIRNTTWGNNKTQVKQIEGNKKPIEETSESLLFKDDINGDEFLIDYEFIDNRLVTIAYIYNEKHTNPNLYLEKYNEYVEILNNKYVKDREEINWSNDLFKDDPKSWGTAISIGHLKMKYYGQSVNTTVGIVIMGDNYETILGIVFTDLKSVDLKRQKIQQEKTLKF